MSDVRHNPEEQRYELEVDGETAVVTYRIEGERISFTHTIVPEELEGQGIGSRLVAAALEDVRGKDLKVVPLCTFVKAYIDRHPEWQGLLA
jgi:hypothetical protein